MNANNIDKRFRGGLGGETLMENFVRKLDTKFFQSKKCPVLYFID